MLEKNYLLSNNSYFHFHETEGGYSYTKYNKNGIEIDGGFLISMSNKIETVIRELAELTDTPELLDNLKHEVDSEVIEMFEEQNIKI